MSSTYQVTDLQCTRYANTTLFLDCRTGVVVYIFLRVLHNYILIWTDINEMLLAGGKKRFFFFRRGSASGRSVLLYLQQYLPMLVCVFIFAPLAR
ncbi:hypothetical protein F5Y08DRAFT_304842 [Xylaria arbuscula]|nr:hypothetical protein F5Y08DRAFT_304842 [Xylaria arbuscula]